MAPFPEAEDMTIKRLYVALKRSDMQLLQMGAHKLHEKYHTGHKFELLDDLRQILSYVEEQNIPNDVKDLLTRTINDILNGEAPNSQNNFMPFENEDNQNNQYINEIHNKENEENQKTFEQDIYKNNDIYNQISEEPVIFTPKEEKSPIDIIYPQNTNLNAIVDIKEENNNTEPIKENNIEQNEPTQEITEVQNPNEIKEEIHQEVILNNEIKKNDNEGAQTENGSFNVPEYIEPPIEEEIVQTQATEPIYSKEQNYKNREEFIKEDIQEDIEEPVCVTPSSEQVQENNQEIKENIEENNNYAAPQNGIILEKKESTLRNVAVFYDDKASETSYLQNKIYRIELDNILLSKEANPINSAAINKSLADTPTDEINEILKMLNTIKGDVHFITTSRSENVIKTFIGNGINFKIPFVNEKDVDCKAVNLIPLFGLSNVFVCPKCGNREYFGGFHNKALTLQCKKCESVMYPDIYEASDYNTNSSPYYWIKAMQLMANADTWILINPPLENNRGIIAEFLKSTFEVACPKKVYILSKETIKKEYYKQIFKEIYNDCDIKSDYITQDNLCEDFINNEMSTLKVNL